MRKLVLLVTMCLMALSMTAQDTPYVIYDCNRCDAQSVRLVR